MTPPPDGPPPDRRRRKQPVPPEQKSRQQLLDSHLSEVGLTVRVVNALEHENIHTVEDLSKVSREELEGMGSFGDITIREIHALLTRLGFKPTWKPPAAKRKKKKKQNKKEA